MNWAVAYTYYIHKEKKVTQELKEFMNLDDFGLPSIDSIEWYK